MIVTLLKHGVAGLEGQLDSRAGPSAAGPSYLIVMLPAVTVAVGNATALRINPRLPAEAVTVKGTPGRAGVPSPMSMVAVPLNVALPSAPTDPPRTSPSTVTFCGVPRGDVPWSTT